MSAACRICGRTELPLNVEPRGGVIPRPPTYICSKCYAAERSELR